MRQKIFDLRLVAGRAAELLIAGMGVLLFSACSNIPSLPIPSETAMPTPTAAPTFAPSKTPTLPPSPTPTLTTTPPPAWVTDFAEPILSAIANRPPTIEDDLHDRSGGWFLADWCRAPASEYYIGGELVLENNCNATRSKMAYTDFVLEIDGRFLEGSSGDARWSIEFREAQGIAYNLNFAYDGGAWFWGYNTLNRSILVEIGQVFSGQATNHILLIARGNQFAVYANGQPLYYVQDETILHKGRIAFWAWVGGNPPMGRSVVAFDNLKIWDISKIPIP